MMLKFVFALCFGLLLLFFFFNTTLSLSEMLPMLKMQERHGKPGIPPVWPLLPRQTHGDSLGPRQKPLG